MSESVKIGGIGKNPAIDRMNSLNSIDIKNYAVKKMEQLLAKTDKIGTDKFYTKPVSVKLSKIKKKGKKIGKKSKTFKVPKENKASKKLQKFKIAKGNMAIKGLQEYKIPKQNKQSKQFQDFIIPKNNNEIKSFQAFKVPNGENTIKRSQEFKVSNEKAPFKQLQGIQHSKLEQTVAAPKRVEEKNIYADNYGKIRMAENKLPSRQNPYYASKRMGTTLERNIGEEISIQNETAGSIRRLTGEQDHHVQSAGQAIARKPDISSDHGDTTGYRTYLSGKH